MLRCFGIVIVAMTLFGARQASAHNALESSDPVAGQVLDQSPTTWTLTFTGNVPLSSATGEIVTAAGSRITLSSPRYGTSEKQIVFDIPEGLSGEVTGRWRLVGTDGHVITSRVKFSVAVTATTLPSTDVIPATTIPLEVEQTQIGTSAITPEPVRLALRVLGYAGLLFVGGLLFTELFVAQGILRTHRTPVMLFIGSVAMSVVPLLQLLIYLDDSRQFGILGSLPRIFESFDSTAGSMFLARIVAGLVLVATSYMLLKGRGSYMTTVPVLGTGVIYLVTLAYTGHSRSMSWPVLGVPAAVGHSLATICWLGGLIAFILFVLPSIDAEKSFDAFRRFGHIATYAVAVMVGTGIIQTVRLHGNFETLFTTSHGRWLLVKLFLVATMLKIGDINRRRLIRNLPTSEVAFQQRVSLLRRASVTEIVNGSLVMVVTGILVSSSFG